MNNFWAGKRVFVTGHTGFKGSWLTIWLKQLGANVIGFSLESFGYDSMFKMANTEQGITSIIGDIRDRHIILDVLENYKPEIIFHLAGQALVRRSYRDPISTFETNVLGTAYLLDAIRKVPSVRAVVNVTTDKCYENTSERPSAGFREDARLGGYDPYSASKACMEILISSFRSSYFNCHDGLDQSRNSVGIATARAGNVIGGGDWAEDRLIPDLIRSLISGVSFLIRSPLSVRPWQHVLEPLYGYLKLGEMLYRDPSAFSEAWNFGPDSEGLLTVQEISQYVAQIWQGKKLVGINRDSRTELHEAEYLSLDSSKAKRRLHWATRFSIHEALDYTVEWYYKYYTNSDLEKVTIEQILRYQELVMGR